ncbi:GNAT family N-acetyltransferase [Umezawaea sp.]|uniref:GNAT family N-acetyltransferase n=1 Tax=Umezawaea sp. TaxID=1955258 RepID=UPI002ED0739C
MDVSTDLGLTTGLITVQEALGADWGATAGLDLVRVVDPPPDSWPALHAAGFRVHPSWITWTAPVGASEDEFLARLDGKERRSIRAGQRFASERGIGMKVVTPLDAQSFDVFLGLYEPQIAAMRHGVPYAALERDEILEQGDDYFAVQAFAADELVGSCVCRIRRDISTVVIRFATTAPGSRQQRLVRALYMKVFQTAREMGHAEISLGTDPALYGHLTRPGLFSFKSGLGFTPVPARLFGSMDDPDEATMALRLDSLTDPSLLVSYDVGGTGRATAPPLRLTVLAGDPDTDTSPYGAPFLTGVDVLAVG